MPSLLQTFAGLTMLLAALVAAMAGMRAGAGPWPGVVVLGLTLLVWMRRRLRGRPKHLDEETRAWLAAHVPLFTHADAPGRARFERAVAAFLAAQRFEAAGEAQWTLERRLAVAAGAATLLHGRPGWSLASRRTMLLYETRFDAQYEKDAEWGEFDGMAHPQGPVIFAADALDHAWDHTDGSNVVLHELAHLFDFDSSGIDGVPSLVADASAEAWAALVRREMQRVRIGKSLLRSYAAHDAAEFFAVSTEVFFERPFALARRHPELFEALTAMYALDPREGWRDVETPNEDADT
ncbi:MAG TPA: zinc-dependent peptidase [Rhodothermales bacterium]|nr:zinc-dependent peptidase [Rhodothermales bacterium]